MSLHALQVLHMLLDLVLQTPSEEVGTHKACIARDTKVPHAVTLCNDFFPGFKLRDCLKACQFACAPGGLP